jgi:methylated-DNA-protein-cysteine methyltransferase related protein
LPKASIPKTATAPRATYARIYAAVSRVPRGRVATYGQIASVAGLPGHARMVGYALAALPEGRRVPWHRVVNAAGKISLRSDGRPMDEIQRFLLEKEGVRFGETGAIPLDRFRWRPAGDGPRTYRTTRQSEEDR